MIDQGQGVPVVRIYLPYVSAVIESIGALSPVRVGEQKKTHFYTLYNARTAVYDFLFGSIWAGSLRVCVAPGNRLLSALDALMEGDDMDEQFEYIKIAVMNQAIADFKTVLQAEFQTAGVYLVTAKRGFDVPTLLENAETIFPPELNQKIPQVQDDLREAGKCIAFNLGTAAGFHLLRALETVVCSYWYVVMNKAPLPNNRNLGNYITEMARGGHPERKKVLFALRQVKDLHRNSIMHPEETLDLDQAIALLSTVQSAIAFMLPTVDGEHGRKLMEASAAKKLRAYEAEEAKRAAEAEDRRKQEIKKKQTSKPRNGS